MAAALSLKQLTNFQRIATFLRAKINDEHFCSHKSMLNKAFSRNVKFINSKQYLPCDCVVNAATRKKHEISVENLLIF